MMMLPLVMGQCQVPGTGLSSFWLSSPQTLICTNTTRPTGPPLMVDCHMPCCNHTVCTYIHVHTYRVTTSPRHCLPSCGCFPLTPDPCMASTGTWGYTRCVLADVHTINVYTLSACPSLHLQNATGDVAASGRRKPPSGTPQFPIKKSCRH